MPKTKNFIFSISIHHYSGDTSKAIKQKTEIRVIHISTKEINLSLFEYDMITYVENSKKSTENN